MRARMLRDLRISIERLLPNGWGDAFRQVGMAATAYIAYRLVEGAVDGSSAPAFAHARDLISLERSLGVFIEPNLQNWASGSHLLMVFATYIYLMAQTFILLGLLVYLYLRHNRSYYFVRNMMFVAMAIGLLGYAFYPTAPPRFLPNWGFVDSVSQVTNTSSHNNAIFNGLVNPYAAVPSMHVAFAAMLGWTLVFLVRNWFARIWWALWPLLVTFVTVITANHFLIDTVLGFATAGVAALAAARLARIRPHAWAFEAKPAGRSAPGVAIS
jgi:membrane-associated phospholipid phosphatase